MVYLDNSATTVPLPEVIEVVKNLLDNNIYGNPNSVYEFGLQSKKLVQDAKKTVANKLNCDESEIYFLPSASYCNAQAIVGYMNSHEKCHNFITSNMEHASISEIKFDVPYKYIHIEKCNNEGLLNPEQFSHYKNCLISVTACESETGVIQPIKEICDMAHKNGNVFYSDLTQYIPYNQVNLKDLNLDMAIFSSHKIHGLKNCGVLYVKNGITLSPIVYGHNMIENGTPDIYQICAMAKAVEMLSYDNIDDLRQKRDYLLDKLLSIDGITLNGSKEFRSPCNINICFKNTGTKLDSQQMVAVLDLLSYCVSAGSACSSGSPEPSKILLALGKTPEEARHSIRITIGDNTYEELDKIFNDFKNIIENYK